MGFKLFRYKDVGSTNIEAKKLIDEGEETPFWVLADSQKKGKGRAGKIWVSEKGNFYSSYALKVEIDINSFYQLSFVAAAAIFDLISELIDFNKNELKIKWPNDILVNGKKLSGVLLESYTTKNGERFIIIGIGINIKHKPIGAEFDAICLNDLNYNILPDDMLIYLNNQLTSWLEKWQNGASFSLIREYLFSNIYGLGKQITINTPKYKIIGEFVDLDEQGALIIIDKNGDRKVITAGDVRIL